MGLTIPVGIDKLCKETAGADGFIIVALLPEEAIELSISCKKYGLPNVPLVAPTSSDNRIGVLTEQASTFIYYVGLAGVTGARDALSDDLEDFVLLVSGQRLIYQ